MERWKSRLHTFYSPDNNRVRKRGSATYFYKENLLGKWIKEILWIYRDKSNDVNLFSEKYGVNYWDKWKNEDGSLGTSYGYQIAKKFISPESKELTDQIDRLIYNIKNNPLNRRHFTSLIDFTDLHKMTLIPCAFMTMWTVEDGYLDLSLIQRSGDFLAAASPGGINEIQYYLLLLIIAKETSLKPGRFVHFTQNLHIYDRHIEILKEIISDENIEILKENKSNPRFSIKNDKGFYDLELDDFVLEGYKPILKKYNIEIAE